MKLRTLLLTTALVASNIAFADAPSHTSKKSNVNQFEDYYARIELGATKANKLKGSVTNAANATTTISNKSKFEFTGGLGGGYTFNEFFKTDLMLQYKQNKFKAGSQYKASAKVNTYDAMLNGYLTAHNDTIFTPYLLAGIGIGHNTAKTGTVKIKKTNFIWNLGLGVEAKVADQVGVDLTYRFVDLGKLGSKTAGGNKVKLKSLKSNELVAGLVYHF